MWALQWLPWRHPTREHGRPSARDCRLIVFRSEQLRTGAAVLKSKYRNNFGHLTLWQICEDARMPAITLAVKDFPALLRGEIRVELFEANEARHLWQKISDGTYSRVVVLHGKDCDHDVALQVRQLHFAAGDALKDVHLLQARVFARGRDEGGHVCWVELGIKSFLARDAKEIFLETYADAGL